MGIREKMNQNPAITTGVTAGIIVLALVVILYQVFGGNGAPSPVTKSWYTIDDGATYFSDDINKIPPFQKDGKQAYRVQVFTCDGGSTKFVAFMERYTPEAAKKLEQVRAKIAAAPKDQPPTDIDLLDQIEMMGREVKAPKTGDTGWVKQADPKAAKVMDLRCPGGGKQENLEPVLP